MSVQQSIPENNSELNKGWKQMQENDEFPQIEVGYLNMQDIQAQ